MRQKNTIIQLLLCLLFFFVPLSALGAPIPALQGRVVDTAAMLSPATVQQLDNLLATLESEDSTQIVVLIIDSLQGENLEEFSLKVAEKWQIGQKGFDNGALLLIAKNDRKLRIEVGYGLEGSLTDLVAGRIIRDIITPQFRNGNFDQGVINGVLAIIGSVRGEFDSSTLPAEKNKKSEEFSGIIIFILFAFFNLGRMFRSRKLLAAGFGAILAPLFGFAIFGAGWPILLLLIPAGIITGYLSSSFGNSLHSRSSSKRRILGSGYTSGGFSSGGGGFSGGGGGFGGGGSSGGW
ncbi:MAG: TPM domain-containing protein [Desulfobulbaceae bacterium]|nr:TPM domain-containing protein [Desulfobulbaceae bacterium]